MKLTPAHKLLKRYGYTPEGVDQITRAVAAKAAKDIALLRATLLAAEAHLEYTSYGDKWERECATHQKLPEQITDTLEKTK